MSPNARSASNSLDPVRRAPAGASNTRCGPLLPAPRGARSRGSRCRSRARMTRACAIRPSILSRQRTDARDQRHVRRPAWSGIVGNRQSSPLHPVRGVIRAVTITTGCDAWSCLSLSRRQTSTRPCRSSMHVEQHVRRIRARSQSPTLPPAADGRHDVEILLVR